MFNRNHRRRGFDFGIGRASPEGRFFRIMQIGSY